MSITTKRPSLNGRYDHMGRNGTSRPASSIARRRQMPLVLAGVLLVIGCALAFAITSIHLAGGSQVLEVTHAVPAGSALTSSDLGVVRVTVAPGLAPINASVETGVLGRPAAVTLVPGTLLTAGDLGNPPSVSAGFDEVALGVKGRTVSTLAWPWRQCQCCSRPRYIRSPFGSITADQRNPSNRTLG